MSELRGYLDALAGQQAIGRRLRALMKARELNATTLAERAGAKDTHVRSILSGHIKMPRFDFGLRLARALGVDPEELVADGRNTVAEEAARYGRVDAPRPEHITSVPVVGVAVGGSPQDAAEVVGEEYSLLHHLYKPGRYVIRLFGDSMHPTFWSNDLLLVDPKEKVKNGEIGLVKVGTESTVKRVFFMKRGQVQLQAENRTFPAVIVDADQEFKIEGKILRIVEGERP